jgi:thioredoxin-related protein
MVFLDAHADWCGFCKKMKRTTYSDKQVGDLLNEKFISISIDMEKGEGIELGQRYGVEAYPTLYILDAQGNLVKESKGYLTPSQLLDFVQ